MPDDTHKIYNNIGLDSVDIEDIEVSTGRGSVVRHWTGISPSLVMKL
jgi:hypothetical protein